MVACGVENLSRVPIGADAEAGAAAGFGKPLSRSYFERFEWATQFEGAERIADEVRHHPSDVRRVRAGVAGACRPGRRRGPLRAADRPARRRDARRGRHSYRRDARGSNATRSPVTRRSSSWRSSSRWPVPTASTPPARRRRSPTAPPPCCMMSAERAAELGAATPRTCGGHGARRLRSRADAGGPDPGHPQAARGEPACR